MAEIDLLPAGPGGFTPASALLAGLIIGSAIFLLSKLVASMGWLQIRQVETLHIPMGAFPETVPEDLWKGRVITGEDLEGRFSVGEQGASIRRWVMDEVVLDESLGID